MTIATRPFRYRKQDLDTARAAKGRTLPILAFVLGVAALGAVVGWGLAAFVGRLLGDTALAIDDPSRLAGWLAFAVTVAVLAVYGRRADVAAGALDALLHPEQSVVFDGEAVRLIGEHGETITRWSGFATATWAGDDLVLTGTGGVVLVVPGEALPDAADRAALRALVAERVAG